jgi:hypothetical protein
VAGNNGWETDSGAVLMQLPGRIPHSVLKQSGMLARAALKGTRLPRTPGQVMFPKWKKLRINLSPGERL